MANLNRVREAKAAIQAAALTRWQRRTNDRDRNKTAIANGGPGAADSHERQELFGRRTASIGLLSTLSARARLPFGIERKMGATLDFLPLPPSEQARRAGRPVARIVDTVDARIEPQGFATGFLVAPDLLITNWHVFPLRADAVGCGAHFLYEQSERGVSRGIVFELRPAEFYVSDEKLDFAVVKVASRATTGEVLSDLGQITLIEARPKILTGQPVNIIQHPEGRPKQYAVSQNRLVDILEEEGMLHYETDTLEGSSGAPAFSDFWEVVALHHTAIPDSRAGKVLARDGSFWTREMGDDAVRWVANEGIRVSAIVARLRAMQPDVGPADAPLLKALVDSTTDPVAEAVAAIGREAGTDARISVQATTGSTGGERYMSGMQFTFTGPVTININAPAAPAAFAATPATSEAPRPAALERSMRFDPNYEGREGYDPSFLGDGIDVPTPEVAAARLREVLKDESGEPLVLKYHHFELVMNRKRRLQMWSAVNVDYAPSRKVSGDRDMWGKDRWIPDPRIPADCQIFDADFYKPAGNIDRGHIVRREDNEWGDSRLEIEYANSDTFHWTNCTPQHEAFNQADPGRTDRTYRGMEGVWGAFENHLQASRVGGDTKACIIAGPILADDDPTADFGRGAIQYPIRFFKVVCVADRSGGRAALAVFGFILSQQDVVTAFGIERFGPGRFKRLQVPLTEIEQAADLTFASSLHAADALAGQQPRLITSMADVKGLDRVAA